MTAPVLVDSCVWIDHLVGRSTPAQRLLAKALQTDDEIVVPSVVMAEVLCGMSDRDAAHAQLLLETETAAPELERRDFLSAAGLYRACRSKGWTIASFPDCLLATLCVRFQYDLLTSDRDFDVMVALTPLRLLR